MKRRLGMRFDREAELDDRGQRFTAIAHALSALDLEQTLMRYAHPYNTQLPQSALRSRAPMQAMKDWHRSHPHLFVKAPRNPTGRDR